MLNNKLYFCINNAVPWNGDKIDTTNSKLINLFNNDDFVVANVEGLRWGQYELSTQTHPYNSGDIVTNKRGIERDITIELKPKGSKGDYTSVFETFAKFLGKEVALCWIDRNTVDGIRDVYITGVLNECEEPAFNDDVRLTMNVHCSFPYWKSKRIYNVVAEMQTIEGTAPTFVVVNAYGVTIPSYLLNEKINGLWLWSGSYNEGNYIRIASPSTSAITGDVVIDPQLYSSESAVTIDGTARLDTVYSPLIALPPSNSVYLTTRTSSTSTNNPFNINYTPLYY